MRVLRFSKAEPGLIFLFGPNHGNDLNVDDDTLSVFDLRLIDPSGRRTAKHLQNQEYLGNCNHDKNLPRQGTIGKLKDQNENNISINPDLLMD